MPPLVLSTMSHDNPLTIPTVPTVILSNGVEMPQIALGTAPLSAEPGQSVPCNPRYVGFFPERVPRSVQLALENGLRHIDTALMYRTQRHIGNVLSQWFASGKIRREDVFLTSKVYHPPSEGFGLPDTTIDMDNLTVEQIEEKMHEHFQKVLLELGVGYVDLMLLHWPGSGGGADAGKQNTVSSGGVKMADIDPVKRAKRIAAWKVLEKYYEMGWARCIGVSNFHETHIQHLLDDGATIKPQVNQLETSIYIQHDSIIKYCKDNVIAVMAYSPFGRGVMNIEDDEVVKAIAAKHKISPGLVALGYLIEKGFAAAFYSSSEERIKSNTSVFSLSFDEDDMAMLNALNRSESWGLPSPYQLS